MERALLPHDGRALSAAIASCWKKRIGRGWALPMVWPRIRVARIAWCTAVTSRRRVSASARCRAICGRRSNSISVPAPSRSARKACRPSMAYRAGMVMSKERGWWLRFRSSDWASVAAPFLALHVTRRPLAKIASSPHSYDHAALFRLTSVRSAIASLTPSRAHSPICFAYNTRTAIGAASCSSIRRCARTTSFIMHWAERVDPVLAGKMCGPHSPPAAFRWRLEYLRGRPERRERKCEGLLCAQAGGPFSQTRRTCRKRGPAFFGSVVFPT